MRIYIIYIRIVNSFYIRIARMRMNIIYIRISLYVSLPVIDYTFAYLIDSTFAWSPTMRMHKLSFAMRMQNI